MSLRLFCLFLTFVFPAVAQDKPAPKLAGGSVQVKFLAEVAPESLGKVFLFLGETKSAPFTLPTNHLSDPIGIGSRVMVIKTLEKEIPLCTVTLPEAGSAFAVVLVTAKAGYTPIVVRTDDPTFKPGDVFFINRSDKTVLGKLGTTPLILKAGETARSHPTGPIDNTYYDIAFATREETGDKILSSSRWPIDNNLRSYLFFFNNANGRTTFRAVDEYLPPAGKPER
ncbi:hypothetical protein HQ447_02480 [bacterium]|nr:hypothetical protein [bacterium]